MQDTVRKLKAEIFQALAHPSRIAILEQLRDGELSTGKLIDRVGLAGQCFPALSGLAGQADRG